MGKAEQVIALKRPDNFGVHVPKLAAVAFVKNQDAVRIVYGVGFVFGNEVVQLLDGGDNNAVWVRAALFVPVFKLALKHGGGAAAVGRALFEAVVFLHGLVVQVFAVYHKQHLVNARQRAGKLRRFERGQGFAAAGGVPYVAACLQRARFFVVFGNFNAA